MRPVGVIGLGLMGGPMVERLLAAGRDVVVSSRSSPPVEAAVARGARAAEGPRGVAAEADVILLSLPDGRVTRAVVEEIQGAGGSPLVVDTSTTSPDDARAAAAALAARGAAFVDAPVSGGPGGVREGRLTVMAGGSEADVDRARAVLAPLAAQVVRCGDVGAGQVAKACNQLVVAATLEVVAEALVLGRAAGCDPAAVRQALLGGYAGSRILELHGARMLAADFEPGGRVHSQLKDLEIGHALAEEHGVPARALELARDRFARLVAEGDGDLDHSAVVTLLEREAGVRLAG